MLPIPRAVWVSSYTPATGPKKGPRDGGPETNSGGSHPFFSYLTVPLMKVTKRLTKLV